MIDQIAKSILAKYNESPAGDALRLLLTGELWFSEAPPEEDTVFPYAVFEFNGSSIDEIAGGQANRIETVSIGVHIFSKNDDGGLEVFAIADAFMTLFDWSELDYTGSAYQHVAIRRNSIANRGKRDNIWMIDLDYDVIYSHS